MAARISGKYTPPPAPSGGGARISGTYTPPAVQNAPMQASPYPSSAQIGQQNRIRLSTGGSQPGWLSKMASNVPAQKQAPVPGGLPVWLGNQRVVVYSWVIAMVVITADEWHNNNILPRPSRLWYATLTFAILAVTGMIQAITPITNALAIGYAIMLTWQYFNKSGQFTAGA